MLNYITRLLKEAHRRSGLYLEENDHVICLMRGQAVLARFSTARVTMLDIHKVADGFVEGG